MGERSEPTVNAAKKSSPERGDRAVRLIVPSAFIAFLLAVSVPAIAEPLYSADNDYLNPELRAKVEKLKEDVKTTPTLRNNLPERADIVWEWMNALALEGVDIPVETPRIIGQARQLDARPQTLILILPFVNDVVREFQIKEEQPGAVGTVTASTDGPFVADSYVTFEQTYTVGEMPMEPGGGVMVAWEIVARLEPFQRENPEAPNYISIRSSNPGAEFENDSRRVLGMHGNIFDPVGLPVFRLKGATLTEGDTITVTYGGNPGMRMQITEVNGCRFPLYVDLEANDNFLSPEWPSIAVVGAEADRVSLFAPSVVEPGEKFRVTIRTEDAFYNRATKGVPEYDLALNGEYVLTVPETQNGWFQSYPLSIDDEGVFRYSVTSDDGTVAGTSNPIWVKSDPPARLYWGDTHAHTNMAEGQGPIENFYRYARDDARLDFVVLSEHDIWMDDREWADMKVAADEFNEEGEFLAYLGYEWTAIVDYGGHHNVLFRSPDGRKRVPIQQTDGLWALFEGLNAANATEDVLVIPHAHIPGDWRIVDPKIEKLVEMVSMHGTFEWFGNYYLQNGHEIGFIGASDDHSGRPGYSGPMPSGPLQQGNGLAAVFAESLTRDDVFTALRAKHAYATSGQRAILDAALNGKPMGTRTAFNAKRTVKGQVMATSPVDTITLVRNGKDHQSLSYLDSTPGDTDWVEVSFASPSEDYIRDTPRGHRIWEGTLHVVNGTIRELTSPGIDNAYSEIARLTDDGAVAFRLSTRGRDNALLLDIDGDLSQVEFEIELAPTAELGVTFPRFYRPDRFPASEFRFELAGLQNGPLTHDLPAGRYTDEVRVRCVEVDGPMDRTFEFTDDENTHDGDYYYLRIKQLDGRLIWSSPWWVGGIPPR